MSLKGSGAPARRAPQVRIGLKRKRTGMDRIVEAATSPATEARVAVLFRHISSAVADLPEHSGLKALQASLQQLNELCREADAACAAIVRSESYYCALLDRLDPAWAVRAAPHAALRSECLTHVCQIISQLSAVTEFRHGENSRLQATVLTKLVRVLEHVPEDMAQKENSANAVLFRHTCEAMTNVSREQKDAKRTILEQGGIPPLVRLLSCLDPRVQRSSTSVLRTLAFKEDSAKRAIVDAGALPPLIRMLRSEDHQTHYEAVGTLGNLVHSSSEIKKVVLTEGALQPVINLLQCTCRDSLREAALLVGQFAQCENVGHGRPNRSRADEDYRVKIVQRGAVPPLIEMLKTQDRALREMAAFALGRLAQNPDNQAGIFAMGVLPPLLDLLSSGVKNLEHNAAFTLYGLADNLDNVAEIVKRGGYEQLRKAKFPDDQPTKDCITKTLKRIAEKVQRTAFIKEHLMSLLRSKTAGMKQRMAVSLAHLLQPDDIARAFRAYGGSTVLLDMVTHVDKLMEDAGTWEDAMQALKQVVDVCVEREQAASDSFVPAMPEKKVYIDKAYVNNPRVHDVVFVVEGEPFYAHKLALAASSDAFSAMFDSGCRESKGGVPSIDIPNIPRPVFEAMMMFIYTGDVGEGVSAAMLPSLLQAADQYLLEKLKVKCAEDIARNLSAENVMEQYDLACQFNAKKLAHSAVAFCMQRHEEMRQAQGDMSFVQLLILIRPVLEEYLDTYLGEQLPADAKAGDSAEGKQEWAGWSGAAAGPSARG